MEQGTLSLYEILGERSTSLCQSAEKNVVENEEVKVSGEFINYSGCQTNSYFFHKKKERSGSLVEYLTRDQGVAGSSLTAVTALCPLCP